MKYLKLTLFFFAAFSILLFSRCGDDSPGCPFCHDNLIAVPVVPTSTPAMSLEMKWCALDGSPIIADPTLMCENNWRDMLRRKHMRAGQCIWLPQCKIFFTPLIGPNNDYGLLTDPDQTVGQPGDVVIDLSINWSPELNDIALLAFAHWNDKQGGVYAIQVRRFLDSTGSPVPVRGVAVHNFGSRPILFITDPEFFASSAYTANINTERTLAHEIGHTLGLCHANGDNGLPCQNGFLGLNVNNNLMSGGGATANSRLLTTSQCDIARTRFPQIFYQPNTGNRVEGFTANHYTNGHESTHWVSFDLDYDKTTGRAGKELAPNNKKAGVDLMAKVVIGENGLKDVTYFEGKGSAFKEISLPKDMLTVTTRTVEVFVTGEVECSSKPAFEQVEVEISPDALAILGL